MGCRFYYGMWVEQEWKAPKLICFHSRGLVQYKDAISPVLDIPLWRNQSPGPWFNIKMSSYQYRKSHCGDRRSYDRLISTMGFPIPVRWHLYIESEPRYHSWSWFNYYVYTRQTEYRIQRLIIGPFYRRLSHHNLNFMPISFYCHLNQTNYYYLYTLYSSCDSNCHDIYKIL